MENTFHESVRALASKAQDIHETLQTEEATKTTLVLPMLVAMGYDVFDHNEVCPEYAADRVKKKGAKVDFAILENGDATILIECKAVIEDLGKARHNSQLWAYFDATPTARFGILTNGIVYRFYTDLDNNNLMDSTPFLEVDLFNLHDSSISEMKKFCKTNFDVNSIFSHAEDLKYSREIRERLMSELEDPSDDFVRQVLKGVYEGKFMQKTLDKFKPLVKRTFQSVVDEAVKKRLSDALKTETQAQEAEAVEESVEKASKIVTTEEELEAYYIIRGILAGHIPASEVAYRDAESYFSVLYADNNRKPICRLNLDARVKHIMIADKDKNFERHDIESLEDIYKYKNELIEIAQHWAE